MRPEEQLHQLLKRQHAKNATLTIGVGIVKNITEKDCDIEREGRPTLHGVRLFAEENKPKDYTTLIPAENSSVLYGIINNQDAEAVLLNCSEIEKVVTKIERTVHEVTKEGHLIKKDDDTLQKIVADFIAEVQKIVVVQGTSPNVAALEQIKNRATTLLQ